MDALMMRWTQLAPVLGLLVCTGSCLAQSRFVVDPSGGWESIIKDAAPGSTVSFKPGKYTGDCDVKLTKNITLVGEQGAASIDCQSRARHFSVENSAHVEIQGLTIENGAAGNLQKDIGGCLLVASSAHVTIKDSNFVFCFASSGGAIHAQDSTVILSGVGFRDCTAHQSGGALSLVNSSSEISFSNFSECTAGLHGGGAYAERSTVRMNGVLMQDNLATDRGGGLCLAHASSATIVRSTFESNWCGVLLFEGLEPVEGEAVSAGGGIGMMHGSVLRASDGVVLRGNGAQSWGGGIYASDQSQVFLSNGVEVTENQAWRGGGVRIMYSLLVAERDIVIKDNTAGIFGHFLESWAAGGLDCFGAGAHCTLSHGVLISGNMCSVGCGALVTQGASATFSKGVDIIDNMATLVGAGLLVWVGCTALMSGVRISNNVHILPKEVTLYGGPAIFSRGALIEVEDGFEMVRNRGTNFGGGAFLWGSSMTIHGACRVANNTASRSGGAFHLIQEAELKIGSGAELVDNEAAESGGAISAELRSRVELDGVRMEGNVAGSSGGGVQCSGCLLRVNRTQVFRNRAPLLGGGIAVTEGGEGQVQSSIIRGNRAGFGGGLAMQSSSLTLRDSALVGNRATQDGGGLLCQGAGQLEVEGVIEIADNSAELSGGGFSARDTCQVRVRGESAVHGNRAGLRGGGVMAGSKGGLELAGAAFRCLNNSAGHQGGGLYYSREVRVRGALTEIRGNRAGTEGGGVCGDGNGAEMKVSGGQTIRVEGNTAQDGGGIALMGVAKISGTALHCPEHCRQSANNSICNLECFLPGCTFDLLDCAERFEQAATDAALPCGRGAGECLLFQEANANFCDEGCFRPRCDWSSANPSCSFVVDAIRACPLIDALTYLSYTKQPDLVFVGPGGPARGLGRCQPGACNTQPPPALPPWCTDAACALPADMSAGWCTTLDDAGQVRIIAFENSANTVGLGHSWGVCSPDLPRLPGRAFDYQPAEMLRIAALPLEALITEFPGCGVVPLIVQGNRAHRNGGGIFKSGCPSADEAEQCFLDEIEGESLIVLHHNVAGSAGGAAYVACHMIGNCDASSGMSTRFAAQVSSIFSFAANAAGSYGPDIATGPLELVLESYTTGYVPGQDLLAVTVSMRDAFGQTITADATSALPFLVSAWVCALDEPACSAAKSLQPASFFFIGPGQQTVVSADFRVLVRTCALGQQSVQVVLETAGANGVQGPTSLQQKLIVDCLPCQRGQEVVRSTAGGRELWACEKCGPGQYEVRQRACHDCPVGAVCDGHNLTSRTEGAVWKPDAGGDVLRLAECPPGYLLVSKKDARDDDCVSCARGTYSLLPASEQTGLATSSTVEAASGSLCKPCPKGAECAGGGNRTQVRAKFGYWVKPAEMRETSKQSEVLVFACPPGACLEGGECVEGREGPICGVCLEGWAQVHGTRCTKCNEGVTVVGIIELAVGWLLLLLAWLYLAVRPIFRTREPPASPGPDADAGSQRSFLGSMPMSFKLQSDMAKPRSMKASVWSLVQRLCSQSYMLPALKVVVTFYQILSSFLYSFDVEWPRIHVEFMKASATTWMDFSNFPGAHCIFKTVSFEGRLLMYAIGPIAVLLFFVGPGVIAIKSGMIPPKDTRYKGVVHNVVLSALWLMFIFYPLVTHATIKNFNCRDLGDGLRLTTNDYAKRCPLDDKGGTVFLVSLVFGVFYSLCIPLFFWFILVRFRVPHMARTKRLDQATFELVALYNKRHGHDLDGLCNLLKVDRTLTRLLSSQGTSREGGVPSLTSHAATSTFRGRCAMLHRHSLDFSGTDGVDLDALCGYLDSVSVYVNFGLLQNTFAAHCDGLGHLDEEGMLLVMQDLLREASAFTGDEAFEGLSNAQMVRLLKERWGRSTPADIERGRMSAAPTSPSRALSLHRRSSEHGNSGSGTNLTGTPRLSLRNSLVTAGSSFRRKGRDGSRSPIRRQRESGNLSPSVRGSSVILASSGFHDYGAELDSASRDQLAWNMEQSMEHLRDLGIIRCTQVSWDGTLGKEEEEAIESIGFLFRGYTINAWYWEIMELLRKFIFSTLVPFIFPGTHSQLVVAFIITTAFLLLTGRKQPLRDPRVEWIQFVASFALSTTLFYGLMLKGFSEDTSGVMVSIKSILGVVSLGLNASVIVLPILLFWLRSINSPHLMWRRFWRQSKHRASILRQTGPREFNSDTGSANEFQLSCATVHLHNHDHEGTPLSRKGRHVLEVASPSEKRMLRSNCSPGRDEVRTTSLTLHADVEEQLGEGEGPCQVRQPSSHPDSDRGADGAASSEPFKFEPTPRTLSTAAYLPRAPGQHVPSERKRATSVSPILMPQQLPEIQLIPTGSRPPPLETGLELRMDAPQITLTVDELLGSLSPPGNQ